MEPILQCSHLTKRYDKGPLALNDLTMELPKGEIIGLLGPNGSGKTTLLKLTAGLLTPTCGEIAVNGMRIGAATKAIVSYLPERTYLSPTMRVDECLNLFSTFYADFDRARAEEMLRLLSVPTAAKIKTLSKGTREKVQLVLVMARRAKLYLLDEPIAGVDPAARDYILSTILRNYDSESTILLSTHLISDIENVLDSFLFIRDGRVICHDRASAVREMRGQTLDEFFREVFRCYAN
ncbi:MAG: ABC transporter ATP-binding protein [Clostridia bacterium]|nr:ABC transporter ATP-binding protein [Clostridia bacterium]